LTGHANAELRNTLHGRLAETGFCSYTNLMRITFDPAKREQTLAERANEREKTRLAAYFNV